jgi:hypothetical protein
MLSVQCQHCLCPVNQGNLTRSRFKHLGLYANVPLTLVSPPIVGELGPRWVCTFYKIRDTKSVVVSRSVRS